MRDVSEVYKIL